MKNKELVTIELDVCPEDFRSLLEIDVPNNKNIPPIDIMARKAIDKELGDNWMISPNEKIHISLLDDKNRPWGIWGSKYNQHNHHEPQEKEFKVKFSDLAYAVFNRAYIIALYSSRQHFPANAPENYKPFGPIAKMKIQFLKEPARPCLLCNEKIACDDLVQACGKCIAERQG